jgi:outer membrane receptor protein involved in Fe transport
MFQSEMGAPGPAARRASLARLLISASGAALVAHSAAFAADAAAGGPTGVEEIVVTAQRRDETLQKVPLTVQALSGVALSRLGISTLDDVLKLLPNVTFSNNGPGQGVIFMRGLSSGADGTQESATIGSFPNVAVYLDDQSLQFPGRNVDVFFADMERVEVLEGPQGTLFGGGAEAGALRYITNKPKLDIFEGNIEAQYGFTAHGDPNSGATATTNIPIINDRLAVRAVIYDDVRGGYINNVPGTFARSNNDLGNNYVNALPAGTPCAPNGTGVAGPAGCTLANAPIANNNSLVANHQNPVTHTGARLSLAYKVNDDWDILVQQSFQTLDAEGVSFEEPNGPNGQPLPALDEVSFSPTYDKDKYESTAWTVNGKAGPLKLVYTGSYFVRNVSQQVDYTNYDRGKYADFYQCTGPYHPGVAYAYWNVGGQKGTQCYSPIASWQETLRNTHLSNEIRVSTPDDWRLRFIGGIFEEEFKIYDATNFNYRSIPGCSPANLTAALAGGPACISDLEPLKGVPTYISGVRSDSTGFAIDAQRGYSQLAAFGSLDFDIIPHVLTLTAGTRYYHYSEYEEGTQMSGFAAGCLDIPNGCTAGDSIIGTGTKTSSGVVGFAPLKATYSGFRSRVNLSWHVTNDALLYYTFSQGFRPGGFNRTGGAEAGAVLGGQYYKPLSYAPDSLTNHEIGFKDEFFDRRLQLNLSAYYMIWNNVQFGFFDPAGGFGNLAFNSNGPGYHIKGAEAQVVGRVTKGLTIQGSASLNDNTQSTSPCLVGNVPGNASFGKCITTFNGQPVNDPYGTIGSVAAFSPKFQGNIRARYDWEVGACKPFISVGLNYTGSMYNEPATYPSGEGVTTVSTTILRYLQPGYATVDASLGVSKDRWTVQLVGTNLADSEASTYTSTAQFIKTIVPLRPRVVNLKVSAKF